MTEAWPFIHAGVTMALEAGRRMAGDDTGEVGKG